MTQEVVRAFFPRQIGRLSYFIRGLLCTVMFETFNAYLEAGSWESAVRDPGVLMAFVGIFFYWVSFVVYPRSRDAGMRLHWLLLAFAPGVNIGLALVLLFSKTKPLLEKETKDEV